ncbi:14664_t:CDS:2, partial [Entrophospora sp. SA101]
KTKFQYLVEKVKSEKQELEQKLIAKIESWKIGVVMVQYVIFALVLKKHLIKSKPAIKSPTKY